LWLFTNLFDSHMALIGSQSRDFSIILGQAV
jgi:hypothetical protein